MLSGSQITSVHAHPLFPSSFLPAFRIMDLNNPAASASQVSPRIGQSRAPTLKGFWRIVSQVWSLLLQIPRLPVLVPSAGVCSCITLVQPFLLNPDLHLRLLAHVLLVPGERERLLVQTDTSTLLYIPRTETDSCYISLAGLGLCASQVNFKPPAFGSECRG